MNLERSIQQNRDDDFIPNLNVLEPAAIKNGVLRMTLQRIKQRSEETTQGSGHKSYVKHSSHGKYSW
jgi:hypothetical protein